MFNKKKEARAEERNSAFFKKGWPDKRKFSVGIVHGWPTTGTRPAYAHDMCLRCSFRLTWGGPYLRGVIGSTVGAYPRGTGSNPVEGNGHFFRSYRQLYLSSFSDTHTHTHQGTSWASSLNLLNSNVVAMTVTSLSLHSFGTHSPHLAGSPWEKISTAQFNCRKRN